MPQNRDRKTRKQRSIFFLVVAQNDDTSKFRFFRYCTYLVMIQEETNTTQQIRKKLTQKKFCTFFKLWKPHFFLRLHHDLISNLRGYCALQLQAFLELGCFSKPRNPEPAKRWNARNRKRQSRIFVGTNQKSKVPQTWHLCVRKCLHLRTGTVDWVAKKKKETKSLKFIPCGEEGNEKFEVHPLWPFLQIWTQKSSDLHNLHSCRLTGIRRAEAHPSCVRYGTRKTSRVLHSPSPVSPPHSPVLLPCTQPSCSSIPEKRRNKVKNIVWRKFDKQGTNA